MVGQTVGKYRIVLRLGRGGMGTVYKAVDQTLEREVAIKILNPDLADAEVLKRFRAEAVTLARLNHPNIATLYELTQHGDDLLMVMEFVRGETFDRLSDRLGPLPFERAAALCAQVLDALGHAHRAGIVHRDLKPANLMASDSGLVKVMDFGIARMVGTEHLTTDGYMMGTPAYMAPEQVMGNEVDGRADLYAMGVVLYRLLTANLPFKADTAIAMAQKQLKDPPTPLRQFRAELPATCQSILDRALAKAPGDRFQSAEEFRSALGYQTTVAPAPADATSTMAVPSAAAMTETALSPVSAVPQPLIQLPARKRRQIIAAAVAAAIVVAVVGSIAIVRIVTVREGTPAAEVAAARLAPAMPAAPASDAGVPSPGPSAASGATSASPVPQPVPNDKGGPVVPPAAPSAGRATTTPGGETPARKAKKDAPIPATVPAVPAVLTPPVVVPPPVVMLPPITFEDVNVLVFDGGKARERDASLRLADGSVQILQGAQRIKNAPYTSILAIFHSHSKEPQWVTPAGVTVTLTKVEGGRLGFFRSDREWVTVRTKNEFIALRTGSSALPDVLNALESRTGLKVIRADGKN
jgi:eukaryotic-like serine/threonine-protein kinase